MPKRLKKDEEKAMSNRVSYFFHLESKYLRKCRNLAKGRLIDRNTRIRRIDNDIVITLYSTDIIRCSLDGTITFNSGSWHSRLTRDRLNKYTPQEVYFFSKANNSIVSVKGYWYEFADKMQISRELNVVGADRAKMPKRVAQDILLTFLDKINFNKST
jgi:hypothetical protein